MDDGLARVVQVKLGSHRRRGAVLDTTPQLLPTPNPARRLTPPATRTHLNLDTTTRYTTTRVEHSREFFLAPPTAAVLKRRSFSSGHPAASYPSLPATSTPSPRCQSPASSTPASPKAEATAGIVRPAFHYVYKPAEVPPAATADPPPSPEHSADTAAQAARPPVISEQALHPMCFAYALLTPPSRNPGADIQGTILAGAPELWASFTLLPSAHGTVGVRFRTPADREAALRLQPFAHGAAGAIVTLVRGWETAVLDDYLIHNIPDFLVRNLDDLLVHVALHRYPTEQRTETEIGANCRGFGWVLEVDRACFAAPDLADVHVVLCVGHPSEIPRELHIVYADGSTSVVPVEILGVCDWPAAFRDHGRYVRFFQQPQGAGAPADLLGSRMQAISLS